MLFGLSALTTHLVDQFPAVSHALLDHTAPVVLPHELSLRVARAVGPRARLAGAVLYERVLNRRTGYFALAEAFYPPLAWVLVYRRECRHLDEQGWADASDWGQYSRHRTSVDLRNIVRDLPLVRHPLHSDPDNWAQMFSNRITSIVEGVVDH